MSLAALPLLSVLVPQASAQAVSAPVWYSAPIALPSPVPQPIFRSASQPLNIAQSQMQPSPDSLFVAYPPAEHETVASQIFFIGTADPNAPVTINGNVIENRSSDGHFAPSLPLEMGENTFVLAQGDQRVTLIINRISIEPPLPEGIGFAEGTLSPAVDIARMPGELVCLSVVASPDAQVTAKLASQTIALTPQTSVDLPPNSSVLTSQTAPVTLSATEYAGCTLPTEPGNLGAPTFTLQAQGETVTAEALGQVSILSPTDFQVAEVTTEQGVARTGPSTNYSRITPLPAGTRAAITGREGEWLRLDYGGWIKESETTVSSASVPPHSIIRGISANQVGDWTEVVFPLQTPVPVTVRQEEQSLALTLHNTTPQTDTIYFSNNPVVERMDFNSVLPDSAEYTFHFKEPQQWGYKLRYEGTSLILSIRHAPNNNSLQGTTILIDPGHGSDADLGARGPTGYPEKDVTLIVSKLLRDELQDRGATVVMTREGDDDLFPADRVEVIEATEPTLALSVHYNALPDAGDALGRSGIGTFWYHPQAHGLASFLHDYLVDALGRESYGVYWNNLALTRPNVTPSVLLELGFMINPEEFEWITDEASQKKLAATLAEGVEVWLSQQQIEQ
ncbi:MAG: N-acetylmuramoyl-L-alanine amidase [Phormidesmis priestleyi Ana]|uniref:N-acetylmuramoyl-L-alanine amidase n=1 Tax=Phormidesmis priestleyi Ana TaxID=1666911 RepID=A0A0P7ZYF0_9CYAN|nr:MAG: N-acetylmuramoyl-L-alanine amidase [Phormidesmis priestleyi Ana]